MKNHPSNRTGFPPHSTLVKIDSLGLKYDPVPMCMYSLYLVPQFYINIGVPFGDAIIIAPWGAQISNATWRKMGGKKSQWNSAWSAA